MTKHQMKNWTFHLMLFKLREYRWEISGEKSISALCALDQIFKCHMKNLTESENLDISHIPLIGLDPCDHVAVDIITDQLQFSCQIPLGKFPVLAKQHKIFTDHIFISVGCSWFWHGRINSFFFCKIKLSQFFNSSIILQKFRNLHGCKSETKGAEREKGMTFWQSLYIIEEASAR